MAKAPFYKVESNEGLLSDIVISLYNNLKKVSAVDFDDFSRNLINHNVMERSIPVMDVMLFINFVNEKNAPKQLKDYFGEKINDFFNNKVAILKLFNDCVEANLHQVPSAESYSVKQVASLLCLNKQTAQILVRNGVIPSFSINSRYRITARDINLFIQANKNRTNKKVEVKNETKVEKIENTKTENKPQKQPETKKEVKTVNNPNSTQKVQNKPQNQSIKKNQNTNQPRPKQQPHQNNTHKQEVNKKKENSTLPYPTLTKPQQGVLEDIGIKKAPIKESIIINKPDEKTEKVKQQPIKSQLDKEAFDDMMEKEEQKQEIPSIIIPSDNKEDEKEDIFGELKSKEELNVIDSELPDLNILDNKEDTEKESKEETEPENKEQNNKFNTNLDFVINNKEENEKIEESKESKEDNVENNKEPYPNLPEQNFILVTESKVRRDVVKKQNSDIIKTEEVDEDGSVQKKKLKINYLNKE